MSKVLFQGERQFVDTSTGEVIDAQVVARSVDGDAGFDKIWLGTILELVEEVGNAKMRVLLWLLQNRDAKNIVHATKDEIASATDTSRATITSLLGALRKANVISEVRRSVWRLNPNVIWKGAHHTRMSVMIRYSDERADMQPDLFAESTPEDLPDNVHALHRAA
jgi:DNA-binding transcriptional ArsR family regulator